MVDDLEAATAFFVELGLKLQGEGTVEGGWVDRVVGLEGVRAGHTIRLKEASTLNLWKRYVARRHQKKHERIEAERARQQVLAGQDAQEAIAEGSAGAQSMFPPA